MASQSRLVRMAEQLASNVSRHAFFRGAKSDSESHFGTTVRIESLLIRAIAIEFLAVTSTCFLTSVVYFKGALTQWEEDIPRGNCCSSRKQSERGPLVTAEHEAFNAKGPAVAGSVST